jgi:hypothetical protein
MFTFNLLNELIRSLVADQYRGRVVSFNTFAIFALTPLGSLLIGWEAAYWGGVVSFYCQFGDCYFDCVLGAF